MPRTMPPMTSAMTRGCRSFDSGQWSRRHATIMMDAYEISPVRTGLQKHIYAHLDDEQHNRVGGIVVRRVGTLQNTGLVRNSTWRVGCSAARHGEIAIKLCFWRLALAQLLAPREKRLSSVRSQIIQRRKLGCGAVNKGRDTLEEASRFPSPQEGRS
jgi:hypothetical protein